MTEKEIIKMYSHNTGKAITALERLGEQIDIDDELEYTYTAETYIQDIENIIRILNDFGDIE
jgi:hypothetical protein